MIDTLAVTITLTCLGTAVVVGAQAGIGRFRWARIVPALGLVEVALLVQALLDVLGLLAGSMLVLTVLVVRLQTTWRSVPG